MSLKDYKGKHVLVVTSIDPYEGELMLPGGNGYVFGLDDCRVFRKESGLFKKRKWQRCAWPDIGFLDGFQYRIYLLDGKGDSLMRRISDNGGIEPEIYDDMELIGEYG